MSGEISSSDLLAACAFLPVMLLTGLYDLREMRIPNWLSWAGLLLFVVCMPVLGLDEWLARVVVGAVAFGVCFSLFAAGWLGGGDAKIFPVCMLFVPSGILAVFMLSFALAMILGMVGIWGARRIFAGRNVVWVSLQPGAAFPMGISIAASLPIAFAAAFLV